MRPRWRPHGHGTTRRRHNSAQRMRTYAALDAPRPHCRSKRRDDPKRSGPAARALGTRGLHLRRPARQPGPRPAASTRRAPSPPERVAARFRAADLRVGLRALRRAGQGDLARRHRHPRHPGAVPGHRHGPRRHGPARPRRRRQRLGRRDDRRPRAPPSPRPPRRRATPGSSRPAPRSGPTPNSPTTSAAQRPRAARSGAPTGSPTSASRSPSTRSAAARASSCAPRSPARGATVETPILDAARAASVHVTWLRDSATGNSDHRELALAGAPAAKLGVPDEPLPPHRAGHAGPPAARRLRPRAARGLAAAARVQLTASIRSARRSARAIVLRLVFARGIDGMIEASATDSPSQPRTRPSPSTTARSRTCRPDGRSRARPRERGAPASTSAPGRTSRAA